MSSESASADMKHANQTREHEHGAQNGGFTRARAYSDSAALISASNDSVRI